MKKETQERLFEQFEKGIVQEQGKAIVEIHNHDEFICMFPNGKIEVLINKKQVMKRIETYFKKHLAKGKIGIGQIEWRDKKNIICKEGIDIDNRERKTK